MRIAADPSSQIFFECYVYTDPKSRTHSFMLAPSEILVHALPPSDNATLGKREGDILVALNRAPKRLRPSSD